MGMVSFELIPGQYRLIAVALEPRGPSLSRCQWGALILEDKGHRVSKVEAEVCLASSAQPLEVREEAATMWWPQPYLGVEDAITSCSVVSVKIWIMALSLMNCDLV